MVKRTQARASSLFLMELIFAILLFIATAAVFVQIFAKAHTMSQDGQKLDFAVNECSALAEIVSSSDSYDAALNLIRSEYADTETDADGNLIIYFDENFAQCIKANASYSIKLNLSTDKGMLSAVISADDFYTLEAKHFTGEV